ncbi:MULTISPECIES: LysR substrate-binding domain-containing protein [Mesorhizobium]|uniref:LysR substrate-binding domain-containing protein n=1 Tax=Mesorhizobium TaxID=68287 RepID=UPI0003CEFBFB|nr:MULTISPECIES: LysR substrate-binding domain-containing protein [Mesorhizobium]ESY68902.1 LysR family transcriptional regulator [Mesorhizobium sp. LNHC232B00]WJI40636.1 LysR substrate-binding domain-containing protein [Mesorhizobium opportunistum]
MKRPSVESLRVLGECVRSGSFAAAAETLFLTPAAVSLRIRTLEQELGKTLFVRRGPRVVPTPDAMALARRVDGALGEIDLALEEFRCARPIIRITAPPTFVSRWLASRVERYQRDNPDGAIELDVSADLRSKDSFDIAIRTGKTGRWPGWQAHALFPVDLTPMLSADLASRHCLRHVSDLANCVLLPHPDWARWLREAGAAEDVRFQYTGIEYPSHDLNADAAVAGNGVALLPRQLFKPMLNEGRLVAPFDHVIGDPHWHFALLHEGETRPELTSLLVWLCSQAGLADRLAA